MPNIGTFAPDQPSNWPSKPGYLHSKSRPKEAKAKSANCTPAKWQQVLLAPCIKIIFAPSSSPEEEMLFCDDDNVYDRPISDDTEKCLKCGFWEEFCRTVADGDCCYESESY